MSWKLIAIIFILISIAEMSLIVWAVRLDRIETEREDICRLDICFVYDAYFYDSVNRDCLCFDGEEKIYKGKII